MTAIIEVDLIVRPGMALQNAGPSTGKGECRETIHHFARGDDRDFVDDCDG
jgi:hypothetical protein